MLVLKHKRGSVVSQVPFCLVDVKLEFERPLKWIGFPALGDPYFIVARCCRHYLVSVMTVGRHVLLIGRPGRRVNADRYVIVTCIFSR